MTNGGEASAVRSRSTLPAQHHSTIDSCLKRLKAAITAFSTLEHALAEEQQILERLYYKGNNQHRSALFWRNVGEMRRVFKRMIGSTKFRVSNTLEGVRSSFHESTSAELSKKAQKRQAWTRVPPAKLIVSTLHNLRETSRLLIKAESIFMSGYRSYELLVQSTTFLPLALALVAIASRAHMLTSDIGGHLEEIWPTTRTIATVLECDHCSPKSLHLRPNSRPGEVERRDAKANSSKTTTSTPVARVSTSVEGGEDVGQSVARQKVPASRGISPRSSAIATPAFASTTTFSPARLSPIIADGAPEPASPQQNTSEPVVGSLLPSSAQHAEGHAPKHDLRTSPMDASVSNLPENGTVVERISATDVLSPAVKYDEGRLRYPAASSRVKQAVASRSLGTGFLFETKERPAGAKAVASASPSPPASKAAEKTELDKKRPAGGSLLEAGSPSAPKKAKTKTRTKRKRSKRGNEIDAIFGGL